MADINVNIYTGRIGTDIELKMTAGANPVAVATFPLAVERPKAKDAEHGETDWLDMVAWRGTAEFCSKYLGKGRKVTVQAVTRTRTWEEKDTGKKRKAVEVPITEIKPADAKPQSNDAGAFQGYTAPPEDFEEISGDESLPF